MTKCTMNASSRLLKMENIHFMYMDTKISDHSDEKWGSETKDLGFHVFMSRNKTRNKVETISQTALYIVRV